MRCLPVIINIIAIVFWYLGTKYEAMGIIVALLSLVFNALTIPIYLVLCNICIKKMGLMRKTFYSFLSITLSTIIHYGSWGVVLAGGRLFTSDTGTVIILLSALFIAYTVVFCGLIIQFVAPRIAPFLGPYKFELKEVESTDGSETDNFIQYMAVTITLLGYFMFPTAAIIMAFIGRKRNPTASKAGFILGVVGLILNILMMAGLSRM